MDVRNHRIGDIWARQASSIRYRGDAGQAGVWSGLWAVLLALLLAVSMGGCAIRLVPAYDPGLVKALDDLNVRTLSLFGALDGGGAASTYPQHEGEYAKLIGGFEALIMRAQARPVPQLAGKLAKLRGVAELCGADAGACVNTSPAAMAEIVVTLERMRDIHRGGGLPEELRQRFKATYQTNIHQVLTIETALAR